MDMESANKTHYVLLEKDEKLGVEIYDETVNELYLFCINEKNVCIRKEGEVIFDVKWQKFADTLDRKKSLKEFLGGMYIEEMVKEIAKGRMFIANLNASDIPENTSGETLILNLK